MSEGKLPKRYRDEMCQCGRCGVDFLWSAEEKRQQKDERDVPSYCPGCRMLMPDTGRERGTVKWYNARKNYGFIVRPKAADLFFHRSQFEDVKRLQEGDLVEFNVVEGEKGWMAAEIRLLEQAEMPESA